jgi:hypothetical protein
MGGRQFYSARTAKHATSRRGLIRGFCFNAGKRNFPDAPLRGLLAWHRSYQSARGVESSEPWLAPVEEKMPESLLEENWSEIPPEWYDFDPDALEKCRNSCGDGENSCGS